jgi:hypothetical protein
MRTFRTLVLATILSASLAACQSIQDLKDVVDGKSADGEAAAASSPSRGSPLSVPPDFSLRPPAGGGSSTDNKASSQTARARVFNSPVGQTPAAAGPGATSGERAFLKKLENSAGTQATPQIRQQIEQESRSTGEQEKQLVDKLLTWREAPDPKTQSPGPGVSEKPVDDTSVVIRKKRGLLESLF